MPEEHLYTVDAVRGGRFGDAIFLVGADEFAGFLSWRDPNRVLDEVRLGVATRPGFPREALEPVLERLERPGRVLFFDILSFRFRALRSAHAPREASPSTTSSRLQCATEMDRLGLYGDTLGGSQSRSI